jgi:O-antigen/teichoic acid export membrane protein
MRSAWSEAHVLGRHALPAALSALLGASAIWAAHALVVRQPGGFAEMGLFGLVLTLRTVVLYVPGLASRAAAPVLCNLHGGQQHAMYRRAYWSTTALAGGATLIAASLVGACSPWLLRLGGREYAGGGWLVLLLLASAVLEAVSLQLFQVLNSHGRLWWQVAVIVPWSALLVLLTGSLVRTHGATALALAYLCAWTLSCLLYTAMAVRLLGEFRGLRRATT